jgi:hypothetical protein
MNLAELNKQLYNVVEFLSENNRKHSILNENILPIPVGKEGFADPAPAEEGLLPEYRDLILRLERVGQAQFNNITRTQDFILPQNESNCIAKVSGH